MYELSLKCGGSSKRRSGGTLTAGVQQLGLIWHPGQQKLKTDENALKKHKGRVYHSFYAFFSIDRTTNIAPKYYPVFLVTEPVFISPTECPTVALKRSKTGHIAYLPRLPLPPASQAACGLTQLTHDSSRPHTVSTGILGAVQCAVSIFKKGFSITGINRNPGRNCQVFGLSCSTVKDI